MSGQTGESSEAAVFLRRILGKKATPEPFVRAVDRYRRENALVGDPARHCSTAAQIQVAVRLRPLLQRADHAALKCGDFEAATVLGDDWAAGRAVIHACGVELDGYTPRIEHKVFGPFHASVPPSAREDAIFSRLVQPLVEAAVRDRDSAVHRTVLGFGQTGSGKTHTLNHASAAAVDFLFGQARVEEVAFEAFELEGSTVRSLLAGQPPLSLLEDGRGVVHVTLSGAVPVAAEHSAVARTSGELHRLLGDALRRRAAQDTARNLASSRTHAFFRFFLRSGTGGGGCLEFVDLAGSENRKDSLLHDRARVEASGRINISLMSLGSCISAVTAGEEYVPWRGDQLPRLLRRSLAPPTSQWSGEEETGRSGGPPPETARLLFIACISPLASDTVQSVRTLGYAEKLQGRGNGGTSRAAGSRSSPPPTPTMRSPEYVAAAARTKKVPQQRKPPNKWSRARVGRWLARYEDGRFAHLAEYLGWADGGVLALDPISSVTNRVRVMGGGKFLSEVKECMACFRAL